MNDALMPADGAAVEIDDIAGLNGIGPQAADDVGIAPGGHEADVLAVLLVGDVETKTPRQFAGLRLGQVAQRKAQKVELLAGGREQKVALVAIGIGGAKQRARTGAQAARSLKLARHEGR